MRGISVNKAIEFVMLCTLFEIVTLSNDEIVSSSVSIHCLFFWLVGCKLKNCLSLAIYFSNYFQTNKTVD